MNWRKIALELIAASNAGEEDRWRSLEERVARELERGQRGKRRHQKDSVPALPVAPGAGKVHWRDRNRNGRCSGCGRPSKNMAGAYCPTCRQRGAANGWCGCGAAVYSDGMCRQASAHVAELRRRREAVAS